MKLDPGAVELTTLLEKRITNYCTNLQVDEIGRVVSVGDGIARVYGLNEIQAGEMVKFASGVKGIIDLHHDIFFFLILILVFVSWMLVRALWHFHYRRNPIPQRIVHGTTIEIIRTISPSIIPMFIAIPSFAPLYSMDFYLDVVALCQPPVEEGPEVSSVGSLGALMRSPEAPSLDWDELLQGRSLNPDQGMGQVGSPTPGDTVSGSAVEGGAAAASASTPPNANAYFLTFLRVPLEDGSFYGYLSWAHMFPEHVQPWHRGTAPWLPEYRVAHELTTARDIQETLGCICCPKASCPLWKPGGWGVLHHHPLPGDISPSQYAYFWQHFPQPKYYVGLR